MVKPTHERPNLPNSSSAQDLIIAAGEAAYSAGFNFAATTLLFEAAILRPALFTDHLRGQELALRIGIEAKYIGWLLATRHHRLAAELHGEPARRPRRRVLVLSPSRPGRVLQFTPQR